VVRTPSDRRILFLIALVVAAGALTGCTGARVPGVVIHVELERTENPPPEGHDSWDGVTPSLATGPHYRWAPTGWVVVQRDDGKGTVLAFSELDIVSYRSRVLVAENARGEWRVLDVTKP
jgi:hypothetical protein